MSKKTILTICVIGGLVIGFFVRSYLHPQEVYVREGDPSVFLDSHVSVDDVADSLDDLDVASSTPIEAPIIKSPITKVDDEEDDVEVVDPLDTTPVDSLEEVVVIPVTHLSNPLITKAIYMTSWVGGVGYWRDDLMRFIDETEVNAIVIDIKDYSGRISFAVNDPYLQEVGSVEVRIPDLRELINEMHARNIYVIGRISVFQDPYFVEKYPEHAVVRASDGEPWEDYKGISWLDASSEEVWKYVVAIGKESYNAGFDELNFDYIRFPSDGNMQDIEYPHSGTRAKSEVMKEFYEYLEKELRPTGAILSADLFGMTTTNRDDLNIGQILEDAAEHFDYIAPMVYPSHYPPNFNGYPNPNDYPYGVIHYSMKTAVDRLKAASTTPHALHGTLTPHQLRPWLQDFDYGGVYGEKEIREQKKAVYDAGLTSWMIWDPSVKYTRSAFDKSI